MKISLLQSILLVMFTMYSVVEALEPLIDSTESLASKQTQRVINKFDTNKDGKIQKSEAVLESKAAWKKLGRLDKNKDNVLDAKEINRSFKTSLKSPGEKLLNVRYKETPQGGVYLDIYFPDDNTSTEKPVIFFTHGGGWAAGDKAKAGQSRFSEVHLALLKQGFCVVSVGYRLVNTKKDTAIRDCVIDCKDAVRFISAHQKTLGVDSNKFYTFGDSAGGHLAMMLLHTSPDTLKGDPELSSYSYQMKAGVSWYGPCDFQNIELFNHDDSPDFNDRFGARIMAKDSDPADMKARYREVSPVIYLTDKSAPLLMIQGDKDITIPVKQAHRMQEALKTVKAPVEIMIVKNSGHNWRSVDAPISPSVEEIIQSTIDFFLKYK